MENNKNNNKKKNIITGVIIGVLVVAVAVLIGVIVTMKHNEPKYDDYANSSNNAIESNDVSDNNLSGGNVSEDNLNNSANDNSGLSGQNEDTTVELYAEISADNTWDNGTNTSATENVVVYNKTQSDISDWHMDITFSSNPEILQMWGATYTISDNTVQITPEDYNEVITGSGSITFGYNISADDVEPASYVIYADDKEYTGNGAETKNSSVNDKAGSDNNIDESSSQENTENISSEDSTDKSNNKENTTSTDSGIKNTVESGTPYENHGQLKVVGTDITDKNGDMYQLKGVSTHGLTWFPDYVNEDCYKTFRDDWGANLIRLAMYTDTGDSYGYCSGGDKEEIKELLDTGVQAATDLGMYVIIDWHILNDNNPNNHIDDAKTFFEEISKKYADYGNVLYEICNEPNGSTSWSDIKAYAETIIPIIRTNSPDAIIIVGTPTWSQDVDVAAGDQITGYDNIMYAVHFYAATHKEDLRNKVKSALSLGLPIFVSEFSICDASGNGAIDYDEADEWFDLINSENMSYAAWNISNKAETSALLKSSCDKTASFTDEDLSDTGVYIKEKISGN